MSHEFDFLEDTKQTIVVFVPGVPCPGGSKKFMGIGRRTGRAIIIDDAGERNTNWKRTIAIFSRQAWPRTALFGPLKVDFQFRMPRPKSHFRTGKHAGEIRSDAPLLHITKPDTTKLVRAAEDGATGILWADDSQICLQSASKLYSDRPGCQITITELK